MKALGWIIAITGGLVGLAIAGLSVWFEEGWSQHFQPDSGYSGDSIRLILIGLAIAVAAVASGAWLIRRGGRG